jgi:membrane-bound lytic murein transglycosylase B
MPPQAAKGSFAGAMGVPQFMPGSYRTYAVDADGSGHPDLWRSAADIAGSVANYLARHDWQKGTAVLLPAAIAETSAMPSCASSTAACPSGAQRRVGRRRRRRRGSGAGPSTSRWACLLLEESVDGVESSTLLASPSTTSTC